MRCKCKRAAASIVETGDAANEVNVIRNADGEPLAYMCKACGKPRDARCAWCGKWTENITRHTRETIKCRMALLKKPPTNKQRDALAAGQKLVDDLRAVLDPTGREVPRR